MAEKTIFKYELPLLGNGRVSPDMPEGAEVVSVGVQNGNIIVWAVVDPYADRVSRTFQIHGTGHALARDVDAGAFVGTVQMGPLVWHVFDVGELHG